MKEQIIPLEPHDDVTSVRDKLGWTRAPRVLLVFPDDSGAHILHNRLDLVLLQREATRRRAQLALITRDPVVAEHARDMGIACFRSIADSHKRYWHTARARIRVERADKAALDPSLAEAATRLRGPDSMLSDRTRRTVALIVFGVTLAMLLLGLYMVAPGATIHLTPAANQVNVTTTVTADPTVSLVDTSDSVIPARTIGIEAEGSTTIETSGTTLVPSTKARGIALFTNLLPEQVTIPAGTVVRTSAAQPVRFATLEDVTLAGKIGDTIEVTIEALEPGFTGNLPGNRINEIEGPLSTRLAVTNADPTRGGDASEVRAVSQDDMDRVRALLLQQLQQRAYADMQTRLLEQTEFLPLESLQVVLVQSETYSGYVGEVQQQLSLSMHVTVQGEAIDERQARQIVYARLADKVGTGYQIGSGSLVFRRGEVTQIDDQRRITFVMQGAGDVSTAIDPAHVQALVRGKKVHDALTLLDREYPLAELPRIDTWPGFWPWMPALPLRITVDIAGQL